MGQTKMTINFQSLSKSDCRGVTPATCTANPISLLGPPPNPNRYATVVIRMPPSIIVGSLETGTRSRARRFGVIAYPDDVVIHSDHDWRRSRRGRGHSLRKAI